MNPIAPFPEGQIESLARLLGECGNGDQITRAFHDRGLEDHSGQSTKWRRLHWVFSDSQRRHGCANRIIDFIQSFLSPGRFVGNSSEFEDHRTRLNAILSLSGLEFGKDGQFRRTTMATTLDQAEARLKTIQRKLHGRSIHHEVTKYCRTELLQDNCFAAVRNPLAHEPKILWDGEEDAADYFTLISLLHRRLDQCVRVSFPRH